MFEDRIVGEIGGGFWRAGAVVLGAEGGMENAPVALLELEDLDGPEELDEGSGPDAAGDPRGIPDR